MSDLDSVRELLRTLAEVRDGPFYALWAKLPRHSGRPMPRFDFRIYQVADGTDASLNIGVSVTRSDFAEVSWGVSLITTPKSFVVTASVEILDGDNIQEVLARSADTQDSREAARLIRQFADEACAGLGHLADEVDKEA